jgi:RHS repeat-associated protein
MGRFSSPDPSGLYCADPTNPQSLNLYSYAVNDPLKNTDPTGMAYCQWDDRTHDDSAGHP